MTREPHTHHLPMCTVGRHGNGRQDLATTAAARMRTMQPRFLGSAPQFLRTAAGVCGLLRVSCQRCPANRRAPLVPHRSSADSTRSAARVTPGPRDPVRSGGAGMDGRTLTRVFSAASIAAGLAALGSILFSYWYRSRQTAMEPHVKALTSPYPGSQVQRFPVPADKVSWSVDWPEYRPVQYTAPSVLAKPVWADPPESDDSFSPRYNTLDGSVDRTSFEGNYHVEDRSPRNPRGRTGVTGRGLLGRWGPNHAADPIITRWKRDGSGQKVVDEVSGSPILQFVAIQRKDCGQWAIPGGMVDPGELVTATLRREFCEEALNSLEKTGEDTDTEKRIDTLFSQEHLLVYRGYVDDPRNTDNAWMETQAVNYHDDTGDMLEQVTLHAGDDAGKVQWVDVSRSCSLYANHARFIQMVAEKRGARW